MSEAPKFDQSTLTAGKALAGSLVVALGLMVGWLTKGYFIDNPPGGTPPPVVVEPPVVTPPAASSKWVSGYIVGYERALQPVDTLDFSAITHAVVGRVVPRADGGLTTNFDIDDSQGPAFARSVAVKAHAAGRKALLMVGGSGALGGFQGATTDANRPKFVIALLKAMADFGFDGVDLDYEPMGAADEPKLAALASALRAAKPGIIITVPVSWGSANEKFFGANAGLFDQINIMSYGMADQWGGWSTWHGSALKGNGPTTPSSVTKSVDLYLAAGVPAAKLGVGIGFYGSCWNGTGTKPGDATTGRVIANDGAMSYKVIMTEYYSSTVYAYDTNAEAPYLGSTSGVGTRRCSFVSYEDERSIAAKAAYVKQKGLGGVIAWTISQGYIPGATKQLTTALKSFQ